MTATHRAKLAYVYVRQSSLGQVQRHAESTDLQYRLVERAVELGWSRDRVRTIDEDLGKSGASAEARPGFQRLIAEPGMARVGLVLSLDASRPARNNADWYQLLELCALFGALLADGERLYDPSAYHDRLLLGLSGMMSEAELRHLKQRLHQGEWHKAERGELRLPLPAGLAYLPGGPVGLNPDQEVQERLRLVFAKFRELGAAKAVGRCRRAAGLPLPVRPLQGPAPPPVRWEPARNHIVLDILKNPAYAGAYTYGKTAVDPARRRLGRPHTGIVHRPLEDWPVLLRGHHPGYLSWEAFVQNQAKLAANQGRFGRRKEGAAGAARKVNALLQGLAVCARCGGRMRVHYSGPTSAFPVSKWLEGKHEGDAPPCQEVRGLGLDAEVERLVLAALAPDQLAIALAALEELEREAAALRQQWRLRLERARYEAERARRQFDACEPANRLVARTLEGQWEEKLRALERLGREAEEHERQGRLVLTAKDRRAILALAADLPALWHAATTTPDERKRLLRLLVRDVILDQHRARGRVRFQLNWQTGATSEHWLVRRVHRYQQHADLERLQERLRALSREDRLDDEIAARLNAEGFRSARSHAFTGPLVWTLRKRWGVAAVNPASNPARWPDGGYSVQAAAAVLGVYPGPVFHWLRLGRLQGRQFRPGLPWRIYLDDARIAELRAYADQARPSKRRAV